MEEEKKSSKKGLAGFLVFLGIVSIGAGVWFAYNGKEAKPSTTTTTPKAVTSPYRMSGNGLEKFDLYFLQLENNKKNMIYSPLSIKYAMEMLAEGAAGDTKTQLDNIIGDYKANKYTNSKNMSFANAMFIKDTYKTKIKADYTQKLSTKYNAEVVFDSFKNAKTINKWVSDKTLKLIGNAFDDETVKQHNFLLVNALGIDMEWKKMIQPDNTSNSWFRVNYEHEKYSQFIDIIMGDEDYNSIKFNNKSMNAKTVEIGASINKYDIVKTLGEDKIRSEVTAAYEKWKKEGNEDKDFNIDTYVKELNSNYKKIDASTDFTFYDDTNVKAFAKDLKEYNGTTLQYVSIMPKTGTLEDYIKNIDATKLNTIISGLKEVKLENFKEGVVTQITGQIPLFKFDYSLDLMNDLKKLDIKDVFDQTKANLSGISTDNVYIDVVSHKANIEFSNHGIKACALTDGGGLGDESYGFQYDFDVPVETIDLTFNNPYLFLIRDKKTGEVWFTGTVYTPVEGKEVKEAK